VNSRPFDGGWSMPGHHAIVWKGGSSAHAALLQADVTDVQILDALESLHAHPGNNLSMDAWEERKNPKNPAPDTVIAGLSSLGHDVVSEEKTPVSFNFAHPVGILVKPDGSLAGGTDPMAPSAAVGLG